MPINNIEAKKIFVPLKEPFEYALDTLRELPYILITIKCEDVIGIGEAAVAIDVTGETQESALSVIELVKKNVLNKNIENKKDVKDIMSDICNHVFGNQAIKSAIEMALFDILGKKTNMPVFKILGGKNKKTIKIQKTFGFFKGDDLENQIKNDVCGSVKLGADVIKLKLGLSKQYDINVVKLVRKYAPKLKIVLDVNQGWKDFKTASSMFATLKKYKISWIEQPVLYWDYDSCAMLRKYKIPVMIDEGIKTISDCRLIKIKKAADLVNVKIAKMGGFLESKKIIDFCDENRIKYMLGDMIHSNIGMAANLHLATLGNFISFDIDNSRVSKDIAGEIINSGLEYQIPQKPGLGVSIL